MWGWGRGIKEELLLGRASFWGDKKHPGLDSGDDGTTQQIYHKH